MFRVLYRSLDRYSLYAKNDGLDDGFRSLYL